ncbi:MAG: hypothetical protein WBH28_20380 [Fuerstiella sp.]
MRTFIYISSIIAMLAIMPGCSRFRELTRRDYAKLHDPFTSTLADADAIAQNAENRERTATGATVARPGDPASAKQQNLLSNAAETRIAANAGFQGINAQGMGDVIGRASGPSLSDFVGNKAEETKTAIAQAGAATQKKVDSDLAGFTEFLESQATASGMTETANELSADFAEISAQAKQDWARTTAAVEEQATPYMNPIQQVSQSVSEFADTQPAQHAAAVNLATTQFNVAQQNKEVATPLLQHNTPSRPTTNSTPSKNTNGSAGIGSDNPFAQLQPTATPRSQPETSSPFYSNQPASPASPAAPAAPEAKWESTVSAPKSKTEAPAFDFNDVPTQNKKMDSGFNFDTGWKPSSMELP